MFEKGQSGNPNGRPKGARNKLSEDFLRDLSAAWDRRGPAVIDKVFDEEPAKAMEMIIDLLPKTATLNVNETITIKSATVRALDEWIESLAGNGIQGELKNSLPN